MVRKYHFYLYARPKTPAKPLCEYNLTFNEDIPVKRKEQVETKLHFDYIVARLFMLFIISIVLCRSIMVYVLSDIYYEIFNVIGIIGLIQTLFSLLSLKQLFFDKFEMKNLVRYVLYIIISYIFEFFISLYHIHSVLIK